MTNKIRPLETSSWHVYETNRDWVDVPYLDTTQNPYLRLGETETTPAFKIERIDLNKTADDVCFGVGVHSRWFVVQKK